MLALCLFVIAWDYALRIATKNSEELGFKLFSYSLHSNENNPIQFHNFNWKEKPVFGVWWAILACGDFSRERCIYTEISLKSDFRTLCKYINALLKIKFKCQNLEKDNILNNIALFQTLQQAKILLPSVKSATKQIGLHIK